MANLAASAVTVNKRWPLGDRTQKLVGKVIDATCVLTGQGTATNKITAAVLGLSKVYAVKACIADGNTLLLASPSYDLTYINLYNMANATDATRVDPVDITDTIRLIVEGKE